ncbi:hypothetical protein P175DRAFT_0470010 [Aspergillus ochraceoroseus IBT 24754]|uniref:Rhodopsin domain-containing protein n=1 Tax=Aspergillus ochraceoroseus IBT 24754 TaxID=1392256 RepID=A0A2T5M6S3_9EURO|nr:uncharacterized protein P175DRAFT_0470010 [Aspergillus ochraceoroseus IBT 24754]PTU24238.1 hypothetical protein P175DRAFT_0470010 [Aspergillus ochraceoroseus IBT 24754]
MGLYVPPGQLPPFQVVDNLHHGAWVIITVGLGLVFSLVSFLIRLYVRLALHPPFAYDDFVLLGATIIAVIQASLLFEASSQGFGTSINLLEDDQVNTIQTLIVISDVLYLITLYTTKCCVVGIYLRLTPQKLHNRASWAALILCTLWLIPAILIITINCELERPWRGTGGRCGSLLARWQFIVALDIATELILFSLAVTLLAGLFMPVKRKLTIASAFIFRLPTIIFAIFHIYTLQISNHSLDPTLAAVQPIIWSQVELHYALIACSVFCLRPFMAAVSTGYGTAGDSTLESSRDASRHNISNSNSNSNPKSGTESGPGPGSRTGAINRSPGSAPGSIKEGRAHGGYGLDATNRAARSIELVGRGRGASGTGSKASAKMIIRKDVQYSVEYNGSRSDGVEVRSGSETGYWDQYLEMPR